ncbi:hypothetical protein Ddc_01121 [Ditylenchus destructor]|nr:hypothetical protein Ddc_01121 [Ditylenchus destructor]
MEIPVNQRASVAETEAAGVVGMDALFWRKVKGRKEDKIVEKGYGANGGGAHRTVQEEDPPYCLVLHVKELYSAVAET